MERGAAGVILYPDPMDFTSRIDTPAADLPPEGIIWSNIKLVPGDPATPDVPSLDGIYR